MVIDYRFSKAIERILETEFAPGGLRMGVSNIAAGLNVSRATVYGWLNMQHEIQFITVSHYIHEKSWRGTLARKVYEIYDDHERWKMERALKKHRRRLSDRQNRACKII